MHDENTNYSRELALLDKAAEFLDSRFRIPGTNIRFGLDFIIGLIPYAGDTITFIISGGLVIILSKRGMSGKALLKMVGNILLDFIVGSIPIAGDLFDLGYKANLRNIRIAKEYYSSGKHTGSAWPIITAIILGMLLIFALSIYGTFLFISWLIELAG